MILLSDGCVCEDVSNYVIMGDNNEGSYFSGRIWK